MKKRCESYTLDTDRDALVASADDRSGGYPRRKSLHVSKAGHFSLHTVLMDRSGQVIGEDLQGLTRDGARDWLMLTCTEAEADLLISQALAKPQKPKRTLISVSLEETDKAALDALKEMTGESTTQLMHRWIAEELAKLR